MENLTGHYIKDLYLYRKMLVIMAATFVLLLGFGLAYRYAYDFGNLAAYTDDIVWSKRVTEITFTFLAGFLTMALSFGFVLTSINSDITSRYIMYAYTTPDFYRKQINAKLMEVLTCIGVSVFVELLYGLIFGLLFGFANVKIALCLGIIAITFMTFILCIAIPLTYKFKSSDKGLGLVMLVGIVLLYGGVLLISISKFRSTFIGKLEKLSERISEEGFGVVPAFFWNNAGVITLILLLIMSCGFLIAYFGLKKVLTRSELICGD